MKDRCPHCGVTWEGDEIPVALFESGNYPTMAAAEKAAESYGWTPENKRRYNINVIGLSDYDSVYAWKCLACETVFDRFTWRVL